MKFWYKDRDFPEIKRPIVGEPAEILAYIPNPKELEKVIQAHNEDVDYLSDRLNEARDEVMDLRVELDRVWRSVLDISDMSCCENSKYPGCVACAAIDLLVHADRFPKSHK